MSALAVGQRERRYSVADRWRPQDAEAVCDWCHRPRPVAYVAHVGARASDGSHIVRTENWCKACLDDVNLDGKGEM